jgi:DNA invertase Pin-like site-specific DNA recombinase
MQDLTAFFWCGTRTGTRTKEDAMDYGYARVSSLDQNPQLQLDALDKAGCWPIVSEKVSGVATRRPVRDEALRQLKRGDTLTVWKLDRLGRSVIELETIVSDLEHRGVKFRSLTESIDTSTAQGRLFFGLLAHFAQFERAILVERTKAGKAARAASGKHPGGDRMYGLEPDRVTERPDEADRLRAAAAVVVQGGSLGRLVDAWNRTGVLTKREQRRRHLLALQEQGLDVAEIAKQEGIPPERVEKYLAYAPSRWSETYVRRMLVNPRVAPIVNRDDPTTYDRLVLTLGPNAVNRGAGTPATHLLSAILRCGLCEHPMYTSRAHAGRSDLVYRCHSPAGSGGRRAGCGKVSVSMRRADEWTREVFVTAVAADEFADSLNARRAELLEGEVTVQQIDAWREEIGELEQVLGTRFAVDAHRARHTELQRLVRQATAGLLARPDLQALYDLPRSEDTLNARWDGWTVQEQRVWLKRVLSHVTCRPAPGVGRGYDVSKRLEPHWRL